MRYIFNTASTLRKVCFVNVSTRFAFDGFECVHRVYKLTGSVGASNLTSLSMYYIHIQMLLVISMSLLMYYILNS